MASITVEK